MGKGKGKWRGDANANNNANGDADDDGKCRVRWENIGPGMRVLRIEGGTQAERDRERERIDKENQESIAKFKEIEKLREEKSKIKRQEKKQRQGGRILSNYDRKNLASAKANGVEFGFPGKYSIQSQVITRTQATSDPRLDPVFLEKRKKRIEDRFQNRKKETRNPCIRDDGEFVYEPAYTSSDDEVEIEIGIRIDPDDLLDVSEDYLHAIDLKCAQAAITHYNKHRETKYELTQTLGSYQLFAGWGSCSNPWHHCNFLAVPISTSRSRTDSKSANKSAHKLFFAELCDLDTLEVSFCYILDDPKTDHGCQGCLKELVHPDHEYLGISRSIFIGQRKAKSSTEQLLARLCHQVLM